MVGTLSATSGQKLLYCCCYHDHLAEQLRDINSQCHTGNDLLHSLQGTPGVPLHIRTSQQCSAQDNSAQQQPHAIAIARRNLPQLPHLSLLALRTSRGHFSAENAPSQLEALYVGRGTILNIFRSLN